jgi:hypothetical protein
MDLDPCETQNFVFFEDIDEDEDNFSDNDDEDDDGDDSLNTFLVDLPSFDDVGSFQDFDVDKLCNPNHTQIGDISLTEDTGEKSFEELLKLIAGVVGLAAIFIFLLTLFIFVAKRICKKSRRKGNNPYLGTAGSYRKIECDYV